MNTYIKVKYKQNNKEYNAQFIDCVVLLYELRTGDFYKEVATNDILIG